MIDIEKRLSGTRWHGTPFAEDALAASEEISRLRSALEAIAVQSWRGIPDKRCQEVARAALKKH